MACASGDGAAHQIEGAEAALARTPFGGGVRLGADTARRRRRRPNANGATLWIGAGRAPAGRPARLGETVVHFIYFDRGERLGQQARP